jgi:luciferase family oxidoreductase group 1
LGSSLFGAQLAAMLGLPYAFASHFAPDALLQAMELYREKFVPSAQLQKPHAMAGVNIIVAETDEDARHLYTSLQMRFTDMVRDARGYMKPPIDDIENYWSGHEKVQAQRMLACSFVGTPKALRGQLRDFMAETGADELMVATAVYDHQARLRSYELLAEV